MVRLIMNLQQTIRRILREELSPRIRRRVPADEMEREFLESFEMAYNITKKRKVLSKQFLDELIYTTVSVMMDSFHWGFVSTLPEDEFWYDEIHNELENHYRERIIKMYKEIEGINESILREEITKGGGIFYHNSDSEIDTFKPQLKDDRNKRKYLFFSNEPNTFIDREYTYKVELVFNPDKIFNPYQHITKYGLTYNLIDYKDEVLDMFSKHTDYFIKEWNRTGVDSVEEVLEYYVDEGNDENDMVGLLYYFLTKWNDSWAIIETDMFLNFIESKGFNGFVTQEEGLINIACRDYISIKILDKYNMW